MTENTITTRYAVQGMDCANCALTLERSLAQIEGVQRVQVNFTAATLEAEGSFDPQTLVNRVQALGYRAVEPDQSTPKVSQAGAEWSIYTRIHERHRNLGTMVGFTQFLWASSHGRLALVGALLLLLTSPLSLWTEQPWLRWLQVAVQMLVAVLAGAPIANKGVRALLVRSEEHTSELQSR